MFINPVEKYTNTYYYWYFPYIYVVFCSLFSHRSIHLLSKQCECYNLPKFSRIYIQTYLGCLCIIRYVLGYKHPDLMPSLYMCILGECNL